MFCPDCGEEISEDSKFCDKCGSQLNESFKTDETPKNPINSKIIIVALISVILILAVGVIVGGGLFKSEVPLQTIDFDGFTIDIPVGANFEEFTSVPAYGNIGGFIYLKNYGQYSDEVSVFGVSKMGPSIPSEMKYEREEGDVVIFKDKEGTGLYMVALQKDDFTFSLMGKDTDTMVKMLNSVVITD